MLKNLEHKYVKIHRAEISLNKLELIVNYPEKRNTTVGFFSLAKTCTMFEVDRENVEI